MPRQLPNLEQMITKIQRMDRKQLKQELIQFQANFTFDFTSDFLDSVSIERLRHIMLAAVLHVRAPDASPS